MGHVIYTNVSLRRAHGGWANSKDLLDSLPSEAKFSDDLRVSESGEEFVRPGVDADFVAGHVLLNQDTWPLNDAGADNKEGSRDILIVEVFEQFPVQYVKLNVRDVMSVSRNTPSVRSRTVIETDTPGILRWADGDVCVPGVSTARPPTIVSCPGIALWTAGASSICQRDIGDVDSVELLHPDRHLVGEESWKLL